jgi:hypothetical protein
MTAFFKNATGIIFAAFLFFFSWYNVSAQTFISCEVNGEEYKGKVEDAVQVSMGKDNFIQIKSEQDNKILYLYIKVSKLSGTVPITLNKAPDDTTGQIPDAEVIWVPDGPDNPQWNTLGGELKVTQFDQENKVISGTFEFKVEKQVYSSKANDSKPIANIREGKFESLKYRIEKQ